MKPHHKGIITGISTIVIYLGIVIITTPALAPIDALAAALMINPIIIFGMGIGIGLQVTLSEKSRLRGCNIDPKRKSLGSNSGCITATSFFSFFSLVPLGCCGWWLYALSLLPSVVGVGASAVLIEYSTALSYIGLIIIFGLAGLSAYRLQKAKMITNIK